MALTQTQIQTAFQNVLQRPASSSELNAYSAASASGALTDSQVYTAIITSPEASNGTYAVTRFYQAAFGRVPDQGGLDQQVDTYNVNGNNLKSIASGFTQATEFTNRYGTDTSVSVAYLQALYVNVLGRTGSSAEIQNWLNAVATPGSGYSSRADVLFGFAQSGEFIQDSNAGVINFLTGAAQGQSVYSGALQTSPNGGGVNLALTTGADALTGTAGNDAFRGDNTTLQASDTITGNGGNDTLTYTDTSATGVSPAPAIVSGVTNINIRNLASNGGSAGTQEVDTATFSALAPGQSFTLAGRTVTNNSNANGAAGTTASAADVQQAFVASPTTAAPTDNLAGNLTTTGAVSAAYTVAVGPNSNTAVLTSTTVGNVQDLAVTGANAGTVSLAINQGTNAVAPTLPQDTVAAGNFAGAVNFNSVNSTSGVNFTGLTANQTVGDIGNGSVTNGNVSGTYVDSVTAATVNISGGTRGGTVAIAGNGITSETINSFGAANAVTAITNSGTTRTVTINAITNLDTGTGITGFANNGTITVSGSATQVKLGTNALDTNLKTIDASGLTAGGVSLTLNAAEPAGFTLKGGQGNDTVTVTNAFNNNQTAGSIDAGAGAGDVINVTSNALTAATGAAFTNFEVLRNSVGGQQNASVVSGITAVQANAAGAGFSGLTAGQAANIAVLVSDPNATFALTNAAGTADVLGLSLTPDTTVNAGSNSTTVINATGLTVDGFETLNVAAGSGGTTVRGGTAGTTFDSVSFANAANLKAIAASGAFALDINASANAALVNTIDASQNTAGVTIETGGQTGALAITGSAGADTITVNAVGGGGTIGAISTGAGNDIIKIAQASFGATTSINGGAGTDILELTDTGTVTIADATFVNVTSIEKLALDATTALTFTVGTNANALATANGGTLDVTAGQTVAATVNASALTGANKLVLDLTSTGADTITTSTGGADVISIKGAHAGAAITINGGLNTGGLTIDTSLSTAATGSVINTGTGNDVIKVGDFTATISTGVGNDAITLTSGTTVQTIDLNASGVSSTTNPTSITNFSAAATTAAGGDALDFVTAAVQTSGSLGNGYTVTSGIATKAGATLADFTATVANASTAGAVGFVVGADTYVAYSDGVATATGGDHLVKLVGVNATVVTTDAGTAGIHIV